MSRPPSQPYRRTTPTVTPVTPVSSVNGGNITVVEICHQLLDEIRRGLEEQRKVKEDVRRIGHAMNRVEETVRKLGENLKDHTEQSFAIETSTFKVNSKIMHGSS